MPRDRLAPILVAAAALLVAAPAAADTLLVANKSDATLSFVDLPGGEVVATAPTGAGPHEVAVSPDGGTAVVTDYGGREPGSTLTVVDVRRAEVVRTIDLGDLRRPHGILFLADGERVVVTVEDARAVAVVDVTGGEVERVIETGQETSHMVALAGDRAYVANIGSGSLTAIDLAAGERLGTVETGEGAEGVAVTPDGSQVWVTNRAADTVTLVDPERLEVVATLDSEGFPIRAEVTPGGDRVLVTNARASALTVIDAERREVERRVPIRIAAADPEDRLFGDRFGDSSVPIGIEISPDGERAYIAHANADRIQVLDLESWETVGLITAGREPDGMAYSPAEVTAEARAQAARAPALAVAGPTQAEDPRADDLASRRQEIFERVDRLEASAGKEPAAERLETFLDLYFDYAMLEYPEFATYIGHPGDHHRWTDNSLAAEERRDREQERALEVLETIDREALEGEDRLDWDLLHERFTDGIRGDRFPGEYLRVSQLGGVHQNVSRMAGVMPTRDVAGYEDLLARLEAVDTLVDNDLEALAIGLEKGVTPPRITLREVPDQVANLLTDDPLASPLLQKFTDFPASIPETERERLRGRAVEIYEEVLRPTYRRLHDFLVERYLPGARESIAMRDLPDGEAWYAYNVRQSTTTELTPEEIHEIGLAEVSRIRAEMERVIEEAGFEGTFEEFTEFLRTDPRFYFATGEELLAAYRDIAKRADPELVKLFGTLPRLPYGVIAVPEYMAEQQTTAYYQGGSLEAGRPGYFYANTSKLDTRPSWEMEALTLHEAVPGHHFQIALQQEIEDLAWFRRFGGYTAFVEGWGLYAESLGEEMGFYQDPYSKFGQLTYEMWRAIRLVVDTGMHHLGWSRERAIDYFLANTGKTEHDIVVEVDRYIVWPGQALAYKIGELKLKELRAHAEEELGDAFDVRAFHDEVLGNGALPLSVLETHLREWVEETKGESA